MWYLLPLDRSPRTCGTMQDTEYRPATLFSFGVSLIISGASPLHLLYVHLAPGVGEPSLHRIEVVVGLLQHPVVLRTSEPMSMVTDLSAPILLRISFSFSVFSPSRYSWPCPPGVPVPGFTGYRDPGPAPGPVERLGWRGTTLFSTFSTDFLSDLFFS